jgi:hypothetical protein
MCARISCIYVRTDKFGAVVAVVAADAAVDAVLDLLEGRADVLLGLLRHLHVLHAQAAGLPDGLQQIVLDVRNVPVVHAGVGASAVYVLSAPTEPIM